MDTPTLIQTEYKAQAGQAHYLTRKVEYLQKSLAYNAGETVYYCFCGQSYVGSSPGCCVACYCDYEDHRDIPLIPVPRAHRGKGAHKIGNQHYVCVVCAQSPRRVEIKPSWTGLTHGIDVGFRWRELPSEENPGNVKVTVLCGGVSTVFSVSPPVAEELADSYGLELCPPFLVNFR